MVNANMIFQRKSTIEGKNKVYIFAYPGIYKSRHKVYIYFNRMVDVISDISTMLNMKRRKLFNEYINLESTTSL